MYILYCSELAADTIVHRNLDGQMVRMFDESFKCHFQCFSVWRRYVYAKRVYWAKYIHIYPVHLHDLPGYIACTTHALLQNILTEQIWWARNSQHTKEQPNSILALLKGTKWCQANRLTWYNLLLTGAVSDSSERLEPRTLCRTWLHTSPVPSDSPLTWCNLSGRQGRLDGGCNPETLALYMLYMYMYFVVGHYVLWWKGWCMHADVHQLSTSMYMYLLRRYLAPLYLWICTFQNILAIGINSCQKHRVAKLFFMLLFYLYVYTMTLIVSFITANYIGVISIMCCNRLTLFYRKHINRLLNVSVFDSH